MNVLPWVHSTASTTVLGAALASACSGCGQRAAFQMRDGYTFNAYVVSNDGPHVFVRGDDDRQYTVPKSEIRNVSHPGTVAMIVGASLVGAGLLASYYVRNSGCGRHDTNVDCEEQYTQNRAMGWFILAVMAGSGTGVGVWGLASHSASMSRYGSTTYNVRESRSRSATVGCSPLPSQAGWPLEALPSRPAQPVCWSREAQ